MVLIDGLNKSDEKQVTGATRANVARECTNQREDSFFRNQTAHVRDQRFIQIVQSQTPAGRNAAIAGIEDRGIHAIWNDAERTLRPILFSPTFGSVLRWRDAQVDQPHAGAENWRWIVVGQSKMDSGSRARPLPYRGQQRYVVDL